MNNLVFRIEEKDQTDSTNSDMKIRAVGGEEEGLVITAKHQVRGRGRLGKRFHSPQGGLYFSILLRPKLPLYLVNRLTFLSAVAVLRALQSCFGIMGQVKWVNDIYVNEKKLCGILLESAVGQGGNADYVVVGIGLNLYSVKDFPNELLRIATSIEDLIFRKPDGALLLKEILQSFSELYQEMVETESFESVMKEYKNALFLLGEEVLVHQPGSVFTAKVLDLTMEGALLIEDKEGTISELISGDVSVKPIN